MLLSLLFLIVMMITMIQLYRYGDISNYLNEGEEVAFQVSHLFIHLSTFVLFDLVLLLYCDSVIFAFYWLFMQYWSCYDFIQIFYAFINSLISSYSCLYFDLL